MEVPLRFARNPGADFSRHAVAGAVVVAVVVPTSRIIKQALGTSDFFKA
jgi:hypothetical protein